MSLNELHNNDKDNEEEAMQISEIESNLPDRERHTQREKKRKVSFPSSHSSV